MFAGLADLLHLIRNPLKPLSAYGEKHRIICLNANDSRYELCKRYFAEIEIKQSISQINWMDLLLRRIRFVSFPSKSDTNSKEDRLKRFVAKFMLLGIGKELSLRNFQEVLFFLKGDHLLFAGTEQVRELYQFHCARFKCFQLKDETSFLRLLPFILVILTRKNQLLDESSGVAVFTNTPNEWIIRAYRACHPQKKIILRFHDCLDRISAQSKSKRRVVRLVKRLVNSGVVDEVESYSRRDALVLGVEYKPNGVDPDQLTNFDLNFRQKLCFFRGAPGSNDGPEDHREASIALIKELLSQFYPGSDKWIDAQIVRSSPDWLAYPFYLATAVQSEIAIDLYRVDPYEGFSYRLPEALWLNKKVITDRLAILDEPFYDKTRFFVIGHDDTDRFGEFISSPYLPVKEEQLRQFDSRNWWI